MQPCSQLSTNSFDPEYMPGKSGSVGVASGKLALFRQQAQVRNGTAIETSGTRYWRILFKCINVRFS